MSSDQPSELTWEEFLGEAMRLPDKPYASHHYEIGSREYWEIFRDACPSLVPFSDEDLDAAEKDSAGYIGRRFDVDCYVFKPIRV